MKNKLTIALAGNPNCGKTTIFNNLTGARQKVGNWPGVTVEKKEGKLKKEIEPFSPSNERRIETLKILNESGIKSYAFISPIIPNLVDVENLINETKGFVDFYWFEFLNLKASGKEFREWLKQNYPESYNLISDKDRAEKYIKEVVEIIKNSNISVKGICVHYPKRVICKSY